MDKAIKTSLSLPRTMREQAQGRANDSHKGNISGYVQHLIQADLDHEPSPTAYDDLIITKLAHTYAGYLAPKLAANLQAEAADQPALLHQILTHIQECYASGATSADMVTVPKWALDKAHPWHQPMPEPLPMAAEDQAAYQKKSAADTFSSLAADGLKKSAQGSHHPIPNPDSNK